MKRDMNLMRAILLHVETAESQDIVTSMGAIPGYTEKQILYHCELALEAGLLKGQYFRTRSESGGVANVERLSWIGHDFLDVARDEKSWSRATQRILKAGGSWTFDLLKKLLVEIAEAVLFPQK